MAIPSLPAGYDIAYRVDAGHDDCQITIGFDKNNELRRIPRFLVQLQYQLADDTSQWQEIARIDHNETSVQGHDVYDQGLHVDVSRKDAAGVHLSLEHGSLDDHRGAVIRQAQKYLKKHASYFIDVFEGNRSPESPPPWGDGGELPPTLITPNNVTTDMSQEEPAEKVLSGEELSDKLAEATGTTVEEIERKAKNIDIAPPEEATVVEK